MLAILAAGLWSLNGALVKLIYQDGAGPHGVTIAFYRSLFAGLCLVPLAWGKFHTLGARRAGPNAVRGPGPRTARLAGRVESPLTMAVERAPGDGPPAEQGAGGPLGIRPAALWCVLLFSLMTVCFVVANTMTAAANAILLQYTSNFWIFVLSPLLLNERPGGRAVGYLLMAMVGIVIIFAGNAATDLAGLIVALASGLFYGLLVMALRHLRDSDAAAVTVLNNLGSALLILPFVLLIDGAALQLDARSLGLLVFMGLVQFGLPYHLFSLSLRRITAYEAGLLTLIEPVLVPIWTYLAVREAVPRETILGGTLILLSLVLFLRSARSSSRDSL